MANIQDAHYPCRPKRLSSMCLYDFVRTIDWYHRDPATGSKTYRLLTKPRVVNHPVFDTDRPEQVDGYYCALVMLFVPFKDEDDLLEPGVTPKEAFSRLRVASTP